MGDVFDIVRNIRANCAARIGCTCYKDVPVKKMADTRNRYFMRLKVEDRCGVLAELTAVFAKYQVSVAQNHPEGDEARRGSGSGSDHRGSKRGRFPHSHGRTFRQTVRP